MRIDATFKILLLASAFIFASCQKGDSIIPDDDPSGTEQEDDGIYKGRIPQELDQLPRLYINTPGKVGVSNDKTKWTELCSIRIDVTVGGKDSTVYEADSLRIRGRGNSTWSKYPKKPYRFNLKHKENLIGSGQTKKWVLLANWMDRTLLRNDVAFEAARRTSMEWAPKGTFVEFYLDGIHLGNYWMGEKINVEKGNFLADYLYQFDTSDGDYSGDFASSRGSWKKGKNGGIPVFLKYPDLDDEEAPASTVQAAQNALKAIEDGIYSSNWSNYININSMVDWLLVNEVCMNPEPKHPKSCYFYIREGKLYAGPVWDFDWGTFTNNEYYSYQMENPINFGAIYYDFLIQQPAFRTRLKQRWNTLKPKFQSLDSYIDQRADMIRNSADSNYALWPIFGTDMNGVYWSGNPLAKDEGIKTGEINFDEKMSFQEAVNSMKQSLATRIEYLDLIINSL